jgi:hypothetical protein
VGDEGNLPDLNVTTTIDKNNITFKLLKNVNCDDLSINVTASYNDVKNQLPLNIKKLSLALTKTGKDFIRQRGDAITVTASSNYFDLAALPLT